MLTVSKVVARVAKVKGSYSTASFYRHAEALDISPVGCRTRPRLYPLEAPAKILAHLGFAPESVLPSIADLRREKGGRK